MNTASSCNPCCGEHAKHIYELDAFASGYTEVLNEIIGSKRITKILISYFNVFTKDFLKKPPMSVLFSLMSMKSIREKNVFFGNSQWKTFCSDVNYLMLKEKRIGLRNITKRPEMSKTMLGAISYWKDEADIAYVIDDGHKEEISEEYSKIQKLSESLEEMKQIKYGDDRREIILRPRKRSIPVFRIHEKYVDFLNNAKAPSWINYSESSDGPPANIDVHVFSLLDGKEDEFEKIEEMNKNYLEAVKEVETSDQILCEYKQKIKSAMDKIPEGPIEIGVFKNKVDLLTLSLSKKIKSLKANLFIIKGCRKITCCSAQGFKKGKSGKRRKNRGAVVREISSLSEYIDNDFSIPKLLYEDSYKGKGRRSGHNQCLKQRIDLANASSFQINLLNPEIVKDLEAVKIEGPTIPERIGEFEVIYNRFKLAFKGNIVNNSGEFKRFKNKIHKNNFKISQRCSSRINSQKDILRELSRVLQDLKEDLNKENHLELNVKTYPVRWQEIEEFMVKLPGKEEEIIKYKNMSKEERRRLYNEKRDREFAIRFQERKRLAEIQKQEEERIQKEKDRIRELGEKERDRKRDRVKELMAQGHSKKSAYEIMRQEERDKASHS